MKGQRRHELEQNALADWLAKVIESVKPYQNAILGAVLLVVLATVAYSWWTRLSAGRNAAGSDAFHRALSQQNLNPADFEAVVQDYPNTNVGFDLW